MKTDNKTVILKINLVLFCVLFIVGCAGPIMETIPTRPSSIEKDLGEAPKHVELIYRVYPNEVHKLLFYAEADVQIKGKERIIYVSGHATASFSDQSLTNNITSVISGEVAGGIVGQSLKKETFKCSITCSEKGRVISTDCEQQFIKTPYFPEGAVSVGSTWSHLDEFYDENLGKVQFVSHDRLSKFVLVNNRVSAKVETEGKIDFPRLGDTSIRFKGVHKGFYYYDLTLRQTTYVEGQFSINVETGGDNFPIKFDMVLKLDLEQSLFKRPIIPYSANPIHRPGKEISAVGLSNVIVVSETADILSGGGTDFSILMTVKKGAKLTLLGEYREWFHVLLENGQGGWISKMFTVPTSRTIHQIDLTDLSSLPRLWEGSWESKKNVKRGGSIRVNIIDVRENRLNGTIALYNSVCPSVSQFRGEVKNGKLIVSADLGPPCGEMKAEAEPHGEGLQGLYEVGIPIPDFGSIRINPK